MASQEIPEKHYPLRDVAKIIGVSVSTVRGLIRSGSLQAVQLPGVYKYAVPERHLISFLHGATPVDPDPIRQKVANFDGEKS